MREYTGHHSGHFGVRSRVKSIVNPHCWFRRHDSSDDELAHQITPIEEGPLSESNGQSMSNNDQSPASYNRERPEQQIMESHVREGVNNLDLRSGDRVSENGVREDQNDVHDLEVPYFSPFTRLIDHHRTASWILERERNPTESAQLRENARNEEEELKLAVALSLSEDSRRSQEEPSNLDIQEQAQLAKAKQNSLEPILSSGAAESLSWSLFTRNCLDWDDTVVDGLYDVWGQVPEILEIAPESGITKQFPSLEELQKIQYIPGDAREVIVVDHEKDSGLCTIDQIAAEAVSHAISSGPTACVKAILRVVIDNMGGHLPKDFLMQRCWEDMQRMKYSSGNLVIYIGQLSIGLARHRALLFKTLADACRLPCKMVRGKHLGEGVYGDQAAVLVRLDEVVYVADLFSGDLSPLTGASGYSSRAISARPSAVETLGLDWQSDVDEPVLMPLESMSHKSQRKLTSNGLRPLSSNTGTQRVSNSGEDHGHPTVQNSEQSTLPVRETRETDSNSLRGPDTEGPKYPFVDHFSTSAPIPPPESSSQPSKQNSQKHSSDNIHSLDDRASKPPDRGHIEFDHRSSLEEQPSGHHLPGKEEYYTSQDTMASPFQTNTGQVLDFREDDADQLDGSFEFVSRQEPENELQLPSLGESPSKTGNTWRKNSLPLDASSNFQASSQKANNRDLPDGSSSLEEKGNVKEEQSKSHERENENGGKTEDEKAEPSYTEVFNKAHWKLRSMADIRRHSDSAIFVDNKRRAPTALQERLETLHELQELQSLHKLSEQYENSGSQEVKLTPEQSALPQVNPAQPISDVTNIALASDRSGSLETSLEPVDEWELNPDDIKKGPRIGYGSFGVVYRGTWLESDVAIKELIDQDICSDVDTKEEFQKETAIMKRLRHVNVLLFLGVVNSPPHMAIVTQYMPRGSIFRILHKSKLVLDCGRKRRMALDIAKGMNYLHSCRPPIIHRDLKSDNLLVDHDFTVKVSDFGLSRARRQTLLSGKSQAGTPHYTAPEVLRGQPYDESSDVYSYGVCVWELLTATKPWDDKSEIQVIGAVGFGGARLQIPPQADPSLASIILKCWDEPKKRPTFKEILQLLKALDPEVFSLSQQQTEA